MSKTRLSKTRIEHSFSVVPNHITFSDKLTLSEKGALIWLLAKPENYGINQKSLATHWQVGTHTVKRISKKLQTTGFLEIQRFSTGETIWHITDTPIDPNKSSLDIDGHEPQVENRPMDTNKDFEPQVEKPHVENRPVLERTDLLVRTDPKTISPSDERQKVSSIEDNFKSLWQVWPNSKKRKRAEKAFKSVLQGKKLKSPNCITEFTNKLITDIAERLRLTNNVFDDGFRNTMFSSYLNGGYWDEELPAKPVDVSGTDEARKASDAISRELFVDRYKK